MKTANTTHRYLIWASLGISVLLVSCKKFVAVEPPQTQLIEAVVFSNDASATSATMGLYSRLNGNLLDISYGGTSIFAGLAGDEILNTSANGDYDPFSKNTLLPNTFYVSTLWTSAYRIIYHANAVIEGLSQSRGVSDSIRTQLTGEAKLIRAFHYFLLINLFGDVPLVVTTDYRVTVTLGRTSKAEVYRLIIEDLREAQRLMTDNYLNADNTPATERVRPNKSAATALLARAYLYTGQWQQAENQATMVLNHTAHYLLENELRNVFTKNSREVIWQVMPVLGSANASEGRFFNTASATSRPTFSLTPSLENAFEAGDQRRQHWTKTNVSGGRTYTFPYKYKLRNTGAPYTEFNVILRLAEQYLIRAEARIRQGNVAGAQDDLNAIRERAGLPNTSSSDAPSMLLAIEKERQVELFTEWGHRWFDLLRTHRVDAVLGSVKPLYWQSTDALFPIPFSEIRFNQALVQNPGY